MVRAYCYEHDFDISIRTADVLEDDVVVAVDDYDFYRIVVLFVLLAGVQDSQKIWLYFL